MRQPDDRSTLELPELGEMPASVGHVQSQRQSEPPKRGRGRPRKPDAMSAADRARRYRRNQKKARQFLDNMQGMSLELARRVAEKLKAAKAPEWRAAQRYVDNYPARPEPEASRKIDVCPAPGQSIDFGQLVDSTLNADWRYDHDNGTWGYFGYRNP